MTEYQYIIDSASLKERYDRICAIITALENQQLLDIGKSGILSYSLDDGQTRISTQYRSADQIMKAIEAYERIKERILNQITGTRIVRLADAGSIQSNGPLQ
ncbi:MAG: hypothetical protein PHW73_00945 [Atribacterota bacterium]|nr:hypothetical protein [Atribacterota bacterium]